MHLPVFLDSRSMIVVVCGSCCGGGGGIILTMTVLVAHTIAHLGRSLHRVRIVVRVLVALDGRIRGRLCRDC